MDLKEQLLSKDKINPRPNEPTAPAVSRRTGIDRRWIPSQNYQPERRGGKDRRATRKRSFTDVLVLNEPEKKVVSPPGVDTDPPGRIAGQTIPSPDEGWVSLSDGKTTK